MAPASSFGGRGPFLVVAALRALGRALGLAGLCGFRLCRSRRHERPWPPPACPRHRGRSRTRRRRGCRSRRGSRPSPPRRRTSRGSRGVRPRPRRLPLQLRRPRGRSRPRHRPRRPRARPAPRVGPALSCPPPRMRVSVHPRQPPVGLRPKPDGLRTPLPLSGRARRGRPAGRGGGECVDARCRASIRGGGPSGPRVLTPHP